MPALSTTSGDISSYSPARWERETPSGCHTSLGLVMQERGYVEAGRVSTGVQALRGKIRLPPAQSCSPQWGPRVRGRGGIGHVLLLSTPSLLLHPVPGPHGGRTAPAIGGARGGSRSNPCHACTPCLKKSQLRWHPGFLGTPQQGVWSQPAPGSNPPSVTHTLLVALTRHIEINMSILITVK